MAIQELTQPIINPIAAFDSTKEHKITFIVIGGAQVTGNRIVISDNQTGNVVYNNTVNTMKLAHTIPANTLSNGGYYNAVIYTIDNSANESVPSTPVPFYCYSQPTLTITNIPATETIGNGTYKFQGNYLQSEGEQLNSYQFILYNSNKDILDRSDIIYYQSNSSLAYTFVGMDNDTSYYVELKGQTVNNTEITSGLMYFTVRYTQPATFAIVDLINDCENGYIQISSNIVAIDGKSNPNPPVYIDGKEVDLRNIDAGITQDMQNGWQYIHKDRFNVTYNSSTGINNLSVNTAANWEIVYLPITVEPNVTYKFNFKCDVLEDYVPFSTYEGVRVQVLNNIIDSINLNNEIAYGYISNLISNKEYEIKFIPTTKTVYIAFNFGFAADGQTVKMNISNLKLYSNNAWVKWNEGFNISDDFTMRVWGRDFNDYERIISLANKENTPDNPNKIEMKWMIADVIDTLPSYSKAFGKNVSIIDGYETKLSDLAIYGNSEQIFSTGDGQNVVGKEVHMKDVLSDGTANIIIQGNQSQATREGYNLLNNEDLTFIRSAKALTTQNNISVTTLTQYSIVSKEEFTSITVNGYSSGTSYEELSLNENKIGNQYYYTFITKDNTKTISFTAATYYNYYNVQNFIDNTKIMLVKGVEVREYEQYGAMPSPNFPSEVQTVGMIKNLLDMSNATGGTSNGITCTVNEDGSYTITGTATSDDIDVFLFGSDAEDAPVLFSLPKGGRYVYGVDLYQNGSLVNTGKYPIAYNNQSPINVSGVRIAQVEEGKTYNKTIYPIISLYDHTVPWVKYGQTTGKVEINIHNRNFLTITDREPLYSGDIETTYSNGIFRCKGNIPKEYYGFTIFNSYGVEMDIPKGTYNISIIPITQIPSDISIEFDIADMYGKRTRFSLNSEQLSNSFILSRQVQSFYISANTQEITDNLDFSFKVQMESGEENNDWVLGKEKTAYMPVQRELLEGDYIGNKEHHAWGKYTITGDENWSMEYGTGMFGMKNVINVKDVNSRIGISNYFKYNNVNSGIYNSLQDGEFAIQYYETEGYTNVFLKYLDILNVDDFKTWLKSKYNSGNPVEIYYKLVTPLDLDLTAEQIAAKSELFGIDLYEPTTSIYNKTNNEAVLNVNYNIFKRTPTPSDPSNIYSVGDKRNLLEDLGSFNIEYSQGYFETTDTTFKLKPNYIYNLSFDYSIASTTTDPYFTVCYKNGTNVVDITRAVLYSNQTSGNNSVSFIVPEDIPNNSTLSIKFIRTIIPADVNVNITNIQLSNGRISNSYRNPTIYSIYPTATKKNIFNYDNIFYIENKNTEISFIQNGISAVLTGTGESAYFSIGFVNNLLPNKRYAFSYSSYGNLTSVKLYAASKDDYTKIREVPMENGIFTAPSNVYNFIVEFILDDTIEDNHVQIWNIQIENNNISEYEGYVQTQTEITSNEQLKSIGNYNDVICSSSLNLLNSDTQIANVESNKDYYLSQSGTNSYQLDYLTEYDNIISSVNIVSGHIVTPETCVKIRVNASSVDIINYKIQLNEGTIQRTYYPYIKKPSIIQYIKTITLTGDENWQLQSVNSYGIANFQFVHNLNAMSDLVISNYFIAQTSLITDTQTEGIKFESNQIFIRINSSDISTVTALKSWLKEKSNNGNPVKVYYVLKNPIITALSTENISNLTGLTTYDGDSNIFTDNNMVASNNFSYISSQTEQSTKNAYVTLKCWNGNVMPYFVHSNYIDIPKETDKVFIWVRKKNNIFDLKIENLGDYQGEET